MKSTDVEIQLVVGKSREGEGWTPVRMLKYPSGWYGCYEGEIDGQYVSLNLHLPLDGLFDAEEENDEHTGPWYCHCGEQVEEDRTTQFYCPTHGFRDTVQNRPPGVHPA
jgi:hypothetical protein